MDIKISTTSSIANAEIIEHYGIISSRIVTGTGIFSDWAAGLSDIFGGRSGVYETQLDNIYNSLIDALKIKARNLGANGIIGLKLDVDEVSGKGMQMFMISGVGTAIRIRSNETIEGSSILSGVAIEKRILNNLYENKLDYLIKQLSSGEDYIDFTNKFHSLIKKIISLNLTISIEKIYLFCLKHNKGSILGDEIIKSSIEVYLYNFADEDKVSAFYKSCLNILSLDEEYAFYTLRSLEVNKYIKQSLYCNYKLIDKYIMKFPMYYWQSIFLSLLNKYQKLYDKNSITYIDNIVTKLNTKPDTLVPIIKNKRGKEFWLCVCGEKHKIGTDQCVYDLNNDKYGSIIQMKKNNLSTINFLTKIKDCYDNFE